MLNELDAYNTINELIREKSAKAIIRAANLCRDMADQPPNITVQSQAWQFLNGFWRSLLGAEMYLEAAAMNWGYGVFDSRPGYVHEIFDHVRQSSKSLVMAASSTSKTFSLVSWLYLDYQRDPQYTAIKCLAVNEQQLKRNIFTHLYSMHDASVMDVAGKQRKDLFLGDDPSNLDSGFEGITMPQGQASTGRLKGIKPKPRKPAHPDFGNQTRLRIFIDEFQNVGEGMEKDFASPLSSASGTERVKLIISGNPEDVTHPFGQLAEPKKGWMQFDLEQDFQWESKRGYNVLRLDGARSENVIEQKEVYPGIISHQGFLDHLSKGDTHPEYICFARGAFPLKGSVNTLIARHLIDRCIGDGLYHEGSTRVGAIDIALRNDKVVMAYGRYGMATGWRDSYATQHMFATGTGDNRKSRFILQLEGFHEFTGFDGDAVTLCKQIIAACRELNIAPRNLAVDQTGLGEGVYSYLKNYMGDIFGINWTDAASEYRIMREDAELPKDKYYKIGDEMWFCLQQWMNFGRC
jgi:hypothetical protein